LQAFALYLEIIRVASAVSRSIEDLCNKSTIFTMQYARSYYRKRSKLHGSYFQIRGWDFPSDEEPHYKDFLALLNTGMISGVKGCFGYPICLV
jgi:hypothetical protein